MELRPSSARGRALILCAAGVVSISALWLVWGNRGTQGVTSAGAPGVGTPVPVDRAAPAFSQPLLSGDGFLSLARYRGQVVIVNFWASWCTPCRREAPLLESLWHSYRARGVQVVGVDYQDGKGAALDFARSFRVTYPSVLDPSGRVGDDFGIFGLPTTYILGPDGRIRFVVNGELHAGSFTAAVESVLRTLESD